MEILSTKCSPQAKGRVERRHGVFQDRFVKELRLQGISSIGEANRVLANGFVEDLNRRFTIPAIVPRTLMLKSIAGWICERSSVLKKHER